MASGAIFSSLRRRRSPMLEAFLAPVDLSDVALSGGFPPPFGVFERFRLREASPPNGGALPQGALPIALPLQDSPRLLRPIE
ncbi:hypothetical protein Fmac_013676 [Flemingia macrophylla]|uniref:Uncharacterized protein n=1 Tax=Flemingia macrophylla TaxID=520843 RepID=A0ABD1MW24_9FABA